ncbi:flippase [Photobacterium iliopiscarium]|uniref:flippase n=1 Tax=Photobacterium iliopiscarium TaxID=56192 RepID=UPI001E37B427|nr:flippase [Photobacterium iliopiscarium]MCD9467695.1 hypothetical protein [Photobacterium iliopiscarium]
MYKNTLINIFGLLIPGLVTIPTMAYLARGLDIELFGILMLMFSVLGYSSLFDAGITRAVIRKIAISDSKAIDRKVMGTALVSVFFLGVFASILVYFFSENISILLNVSEDKFNEVVISIKVLALIIPFFLIGTVSFSYLEGKQLFFELNKYKILTGLILSIIPVVFVFFDPTLLSAIMGLFFARVIVSIIGYLSCKKNIGNGFIQFEYSVFYELLVFGGWMTISNIISPLMVYFDRFIIASIMGADKVAYFAAPKDLIQKISILPTAVSRTIFPFFSQNSNSKKEIIKLEIEMYGVLSLCLILFLIPMFFYAKEILSLWLGSNYGEHSYVILRILIIGFFFNSLAQIPFSKIQAFGKSKITALIHMVEVIPFLIILYTLIHMYGFIGAAFAWSFRVICDYIILEFFSRRL